MTEIYLKQLDPTLPVPSRANTGDAGLDLYAAHWTSLLPGARQLVATGIAIDIPVGMVGLIHPRSGLAVKQGLSIVNAPGTVDAGYRGEIKVCLINLDPDKTITIKRGDRIAQLLIQRVELPTVVVVEDLSESDRGENGFGSSGGHDSLEKTT